MVDVYIDSSGIGRQTLLWNDLAKIRIEKVVGVELFGTVMGLPFPARILEVSDEFFLLRVDGDDEVAPGNGIRRSWLQCSRPRVPGFELPLPPRDGVGSRSTLRKGSDICRR